LGLTKKIGLPRYSSLGASCQLEVELDHAVLDHDLERFRQHARRAYSACAEAVQEELDRQQSSAAEPDSDSEATAPPHNGSSAATEEDQSSSTATLQATPRQLSFARQLATQIRGVGLRRLEALATARFQVPLATLSSSQASELIHWLKQLRAGTVDFDSLLENSCC
jgi:hypothetical protein